MRIRPQPHNRDDDDKNSKETSSHKAHNAEKKFKLPKNDQGGAQLANQQQSNQIMGSEKAEGVKTEGIKSAQQMGNANNAILKMVDSMRIGQVGEKQMLDATLKTDESIHTSLRGASIRLEMTTEGLKVQIEPVDGQKDMAQALIAEHHDQVVQLQQSLAAKNINLQHLQIGDHVVDLPHEKPLSPSELFSGQQLDQGKGEGHDPRGEPPERIDPTEKN